MGNRFTGMGNLGDNPTLKQVIVEGEPRKVCEMRVYFDEYRPDGGGGFEQAGGFWLAVNVWRASLAENCSQHLRKGARVSVTGRLDMQTWTDKEGEERNELRLIAEDVTLALGRIESVRMRPKRGADDAAREAEEGLEQAA